MTNQKRRKIIKEVKLISKQKDIDISTEREQDKLIKEVCEDMGDTFVDFYDADGRLLNKMLLELN